MCIKNFLYKCSETNNSDYGLFVSRLALWFFMFYHGAQKVWSWFFWGAWYEWAMWFLTWEMVGVPMFIALLVIIWEFVWGLAMMLGLRVRFVAASFIVILLWAIFFVHFKEGFVGYEKHMLAIAMSIALLINWWGAFSIDNVVKKLFK